MKLTSSLRNTLVSQSNTKTFVKGDYVEANQKIESYKESYTCEGGKKKVLAMERNNFPFDVDVSWLSAAATTYDISPNINDYLIFDVMCLTVDCPNRNLQAFPYSEVTYFDYAYGKMIYDTFTGKPSCLNHANQVDQDTNLAKGVIFASTMQYIPKYDIYKIRLLQGFDRTKDSKLAKGAESGKLKYFSMGALVSQFLCPITGLVEGQHGSAVSKYPRGSVVNGHLVFSLCVGVCYIENSILTNDPADPSAEGQLY